MAKFYAVKGEENKIFNAWEECSSYLVGKKGYKYKSFSSLAEAEAFLSGEDYYDNAVENDLKAGYAVAYTDGSYEETINGYSYGVVVIYGKDKMEKFSGFGNLEGFLPARNIAGETLGALTAVKWAYFNGCKKLKIYHDYAGLSFWAERKWAAKSPVSEWYVREITKYLSVVDVEFVKVKGHSNDKYNEVVDKLAKNALIYGEELPLAPVDRGFKIRGEYYGLFLERFNAESKAGHENIRNGVSFTYGKEIIYAFPMGNYAVISGNGGFLYCLAASVACKTYESDLRSIGRVIDEAFDLDLYFVGDKEPFGIKTSERLISGTKAENYAPYLIFALHSVEQAIREALKIEKTDRISNRFSEKSGRFVLKEKIAECEKVENLYNLFYDLRVGYFTLNLSEKEALKLIKTIKKLLD